MSELPFPTIQSGEEEAGIENKVTGLMFLIPAPSGVIVPVPEYPGRRYAPVKKNIANTKIKSKDVLLVNYPKTGIV